MEEKVAEKISEIYVTLKRARELKRQFDHATSLAYLGDGEAMTGALKIAEQISTLYVKQSERLLKMI